VAFSFLRTSSFLERKRFMSQWGMDALGLGKNVSQYYVRNNKPILPFPANQSMHSSRREATSRSWTTRWPSAGYVRTVVEGGEDERSEAWRHDHGVCQ
jgi:hypothetical protein